MELLIILALIVGSFYLAPKVIKFFIGFGITLIVIKFFKIFFKITITLVILVLVLKFLS